MQLIYIYIKYIARQQCVVFILNNHIYSKTNETAKRYSIWLLIHQHLQEISVNLRCKHLKGN